MEYRDCARKMGGGTDAGYAAQGGEGFLAAIA